MVPSWPLCDRVGFFIISPFSRALAKQLICVGSMVIGMGGGPAVAKVRVDNYGISSVSSISSPSSGSAFRSNIFGLGLWW